MFAFWHKGRDHFAPHFGNPNYASKINSIEVSHWTRGYGSWPSVISSIFEGMDWLSRPWEAWFPSDKAAGSERVYPDDPPSTNGQLLCGSSSDLSSAEDATYDLVITDPPFGDNLYYADLANFFHVWLRLPLQKQYPELFGPTTTPNAQEAIKLRSLPEEEANARYRGLLTACWIEAHRTLKDGGLLAFTFHHSEDAQWGIVLESLFDAGFILEQTFPVASDEMKGEGGAMGAKGTEYDIIHVCRKRLEEPQSVSWPKMRQWVKAELKRLRALLESYKARELSDADVRVILRGKALEFYSRHYGRVYTSEDAELSIRHALLGINQLLDEDTGEPGERPPTVFQPVCYEFLRLFGNRASLTRDEVSKSLRGTTLAPKEFVDHGWTEERNKVFYRVPVRERFEICRQRPRKEMKTDIDQAYFLIGAALADSGVNIETELDNDWQKNGGRVFHSRAVEILLEWIGKTSVEPELQQATSVAIRLLRASIDKHRAQIAEELLFPDMVEL